MTADGASRSWPRYAERYPENLASARAIVPLLLEIIPRPRHVVDVGGGTGAWCRVLRDHGVEKVTCVDHPGIPADQLLIRPEEFVGWDLSLSMPSPIPCDLMLCLEVAEHLPPSRSEELVDFLTASAGLVLFSAAIPGQPDPEHVNARPPAYWKAVFARRGFERYDVMRPRIAERAEISYWYRQNLFLFADAAHAGRLRGATTAFRRIPDDMELVHDRVLEVYRARLSSPSFRKLLGMTLAAACSAVRRRLRRER